MPGYDWDALAPHWHLFEARGFADVLAAALLRDRLRAPLLVVGAGLGRYAAKLRDAVGRTVALDSARQMAVRGVATYRLPYVVAAAHDLPFADEAFAGVVCASGVIEGMTGAGRLALLRELGRVSSSGFYLAAFVARDEEATASVHDVIDRWNAGVIAHPVFDEIATALGERAAAASLLRRALPPTEPAITERMLIESAAQHELSVRRVDQDGARGVTLWFLR